MKIKHLFGLAVIAAMTASCSSNEDQGTAGPGTGTNEAGVGYATFTINLPTTSGSTTSGARGTRAGEITFEKGDQKEYDVNNATLLIFKEAGTSEKDYTFVESVSLGSMAPWKDPSETGVTTHAKITAKLNKVNTTDKFYALVLLNNGTESSKKVDLPADNQTFSAWNEANVINKIANTDDGFYMANAPLYKDNKVTTLVPIESTKIYPTETQAASNPSTDIYVERGVAKVTVTSASSAKKTIADGTYKDDEVTIQDWVLDVTNKKSFPVHKTDGTGYDKIWSNTATPSSTTNNATTLRFVDNNTTTAAKRVYWGVDPNYDIAELNDAEAAVSKTKRTENFNYVGKDKLTATTFTSDAQYCLENTFNLDNMMQGQTTRVVFKAKYVPNGFTPGETFYMVGKNTAIWTEANLKDEIKAAVTKVVASATTTNTTVELTDAAGGNDITKAGNHLLALGNISVTGVTLNQDNINAINAKLGLKEGEGISTYQNAEAYYIARVKHFGVLTPWEAGQSYGTDNLSFLGRYGVLRNNWYELTVDKVSGPGYPDVPDVKPNVPDDENFKYISVSVKILSWAKRTDTVDL